VTLLITTHPFLSAAQFTSVELDLLLSYAGFSSEQLEEHRELLRGLASYLLSYYNLQQKGSGHSVALRMLLL